MACSVNVDSYFLADTVPVTSYPFSITGWFRVNQGSQYTSLVGLSNVTPSADYQLFYEGNSTRKFGLNANVSGSAVARSAVPMVIGQWHYLTANFTSNTYREVLLDGGNSGVNTATRAFVGADTFYVGNTINTSLAEIAELAVVGTTISSEEATLLAQGLPLLATRFANDVLAYYDFLRNTNRPGLGPRLVSQGSPSVVNHPRVLSAIAGQSLSVPVRVCGPWQVEQALSRGTYAGMGQHSVTGVDSSDLILAGEVTS